MELVRVFFDPCRHSIRPSQIKFLAISIGPSHNGSFERSQLPGIIQKMDSKRHSHSTCVAFSLSIFHHPASILIHEVTKRDIYSLRESFNHHHAICKAGLEDHRLHLIYARHRRPDRAAHYIHRKLDISLLHDEVWRFGFLVSPSRKFKIPVTLALVHGKQRHLRISVEAQFKEKLRSDSL